VNHLFHAKNIGNNNPISNCNALSFTDRIDMLKDRYNINNNFYREENNNEDVIMEKEYFLTKLSISKIDFNFNSKFFFFNSKIFFSKTFASFIKLIWIQFFNKFQ